MLWKRLRLTLDMIKFEHSVFALPFALTGALLAFRDGGYASAEIGGKLLWIVVAMVGARSAAMAFNRLVDASIDGRNPRTKMRHLPAGMLSRGFSWGFVAAASLLFFLAAAASIRCVSSWRRWHSASFSSTPSRSVLLPSHTWY